MEQWKPSLDFADYQGVIDKIREYIKAGDCYQVNYTLRLLSRFTGDPYDYFLSLCRAQRAQYSAFVQMDQHALCCASPELFFKLEGENIVSRPMKGTLGRGASDKTDLVRMKHLQASEKNRAENVMIVDMVRNDLGRIAVPGSVEVARMFDVERYPTVLQVTSTVQARTRVGFTDILGALFPCASITGAPKVRTMQIINELEPDPRGVYTGTIGYLSPGRHAQFNVAIRTVDIELKSGRAEYGVGGGIVWDSSAEDEYAECRSKASVLTVQIPDFQLLETILWTPDDGFFLLERHLARICRTAEYFKFSISESQIHNCLLSKAQFFSRQEMRVRLRVGRGGDIVVEATEHKPVLAPWRIAVAKEPVHSEDPFLYHKTTNRRVYDDARAKVSEYDDVLLYNERGEITETSIANIVLVINDRKVTPHEDSGLLPGVFRQHLLDCGEIQESTIRMEDLKQASHIYLTNSSGSGFLRIWMNPVYEFCASF